MSFSKAADALEGSDANWRGGWPVTRKSTGRYPPHGGMVQESDAAVRAARQVLSLVSLMNDLRSNMDAGVMTFRRTTS